MLLLAGRLHSLLHHIPPNFILGVGSQVGTRSNSFSVRRVLGPLKALAGACSHPWKPEVEFDSPKAFLGFKAVEQIEFRGSLLLPAAATEIPNAPYASFLQSFACFFMRHCHSII